MGMIEVYELIKDYGNHRAVNHLSFTARPGIVTGFVGPKGSGKSTTMRIILGLDDPTSGTALVNRQRHAALERPIQTVGAMLDAKTMLGDRTAADHLRTLGHDSGIGPHRITKVLHEMEPKHSHPRPWRARSRRFIAQGGRTGPVPYRA
jgi:ABC-2 type transport system ATP-binding protein